MKIDRLQLFGLLDAALDGHQHHQNFHVKLEDRIMKLTDELGADMIIRADLETQRLEKEAETMGEKVKAKMNRKAALWRRFKSTGIIFIYFGLG